MTAGVGKPVQPDDVETVNVRPSSAMPVTSGLVDASGAMVTAPIESDHLTVDPTVFVAVTFARRCLPPKPEFTMRLDASAPAVVIFVQLLGTVVGRVVTAAVHVNHS